MNAEFLAVLEYWEKEKGITKDVLLNAVQESLLAAAKKAVGPARELRVAIDPKSGDIKAWARLVVTERVVSKHDQMSVFDARRAKFPDAKVGDEIDVEVTPAGPGSPVTWVDLKDGLTYAATISTAGKVSGTASRKSDRQRDQLRRAEKRRAPAQSALPAQCQHLQPLR